MTMGLQDFAWGWDGGVKKHVFLELSPFFHDPADVCNLTSGSSAFSKSSLASRGEEFDPGPEMRLDRSELFVK